MATTFYKSSPHSARVQFGLKAPATALKQAILHIGDPPLASSPAMTIVAGDNNINFPITFPNQIGTYDTYLDIYIDGIIKEHLLVPDVGDVTLQPYPAFLYSNQQVTLSPSWQGSPWLTAYVTIQLTNPSTQSVSHKLHLWRILGGGENDVFAINASYAWEQNIVLFGGESAYTEFGPGYAQIVLAANQAGSIFIQDEDGNRGPIFNYYP